MEGATGDPKGRENGQETQPRMRSHKEHNQPKITQEKLGCSAGSK